METETAVQTVCAGTVIVCTRPAGEHNPSHPLAPGDWWAVFASALATCQCVHARNRFIEIGGEDRVNSTPNLVRVVPMWSFLGFN